MLALSAFREMWLSGTTTSFGPSPGNAPTESTACGSDAKISLRLCDWAEAGLMMEGANHNASAAAVNTGVSFFMFSSHPDNRPDPQDLWSLLVRDPDRHAGMLQSH
jgi:hypothetical protein